MKHIFEIGKLFIRRETGSRTKEKKKEKKEGKRRERLEPGRIKGNVVSGVRSKVRRLE